MRGLCLSETCKGLPGNRLLGMCKGCGCLCLRYAKSVSGDDRRICKGDHAWLTIIPGICKGCAWLTIIPGICKGCAWLMIMPGICKGCDRFCLDMQGL
jgi:hypothetical protein